MNPYPARKIIAIQMVAGWRGCALTAVIIAVRAFQPGAEPMSEWSWQSWLAMLIPAMLPLYTWAAVGFLWLFATAAASLLERAVRRKF